MKISSRLVNNLRLLIEGESIPASRLRTLSAELLAEDLLSVVAHGSRKTICATDPIALKIYLVSTYPELVDLNYNENILAGKEADRSTQAYLNGDSKNVRKRSCPGFPVNSCKPIHCILNNKNITIYPPEGSFMFISDWQNFIVPKDTFIVGVENMESFRMVRKWSYLIDELNNNQPCNFLCVYRYYNQPNKDKDYGSKDLRYWLKSIPNRYIHFGDFDLAGINIFLKEFYTELGDRAQFLIPKDIEKRLAKGSSKRYDNQNLPNLKSDNPQLQALIDLINHYHKGYDQEGYNIK